MDRKTLLAIALCFLIYSGWHKYFIEPRMQSQAVLQNSIQSKAPSSLPKANQAVNATQTLKLKNGLGEAALGNGGSVFVGWQLNNYRTTLATDSPPIDLKEVVQRPQEVSFAFDDPSFAYLSEAQGVLSEKDGIISWSFEDENVRLTREVQRLNSESLSLDLKLSFHFKKHSPKYAFVSLNGQSSSQDPEAQDRQLLYFTKDSIERVAIKESISQSAVTTPVRYIGVGSRYFVFSLLAEAPFTPQALVQPVGPYAGRVSLVYPIVGPEMSLPFKVYFGPKDLKLLNQVDPVLNHTVDLGFFEAFAYPLLKALKALYEYLHNYGFAIIVLTLLLKILTFPLTYKSMKSMKKMAKIQPQIQSLRERFKDDREAQNREMLSLMKKHGYNPMAGCLPMVIQMPIFFALYRVLYSSIELFHAPFGLWIYDLSSRDPYYVLPVLMTITMFFQQKLTPMTTTDPAQAKVMQAMPIMFGAFMLTLPSGLTLYTLVNTLAGIIQQLILNKRLKEASV